MRLACPEEFSVAYSDYRHHSGYAKRAGLFISHPQPIAIVGCGFGFLVIELRRLGLDARGFDVSPYCWSNAEVPIELHDICAAPLPSHFGTIITEDMLPWLTDEEARRAAENCRLSGRMVVHLVTESGQADYNYHSTGYWMSLTNQLTVSLEGM